MVTNSDEQGAQALLDADLNEICAVGAGESILKLESPWPYRIEGFLLVDAAGNVVKAFGPDGKPFSQKEAFQCWTPGEAAYALQNGKWRALDLTQYYPQAGQAGSEPYARALALCEAYIVVDTGVHWYSAGAPHDTFAVNWDGNKIDNCPLVPFFGLIGYQTAGEQGPAYYWVEQGGRKGYINLNGEWLFVAP